MEASSIPRAGRRKALTSVLALQFLVASMGLVIWVLSLHRRERLRKQANEYESTARPAPRPQSDLLFDGARDRAAPEAPVPRFVGAGLDRPRAKVFVAVENTDENPADLWNVEPRNPVWAPRMEAVLSAKLEGLRAKLDFEDTKIDYECRESSCRIHFSFSKADLFRAQDLGAPNPQIAMIHETGIWASLMYEIPVDGKPVAFPDVFVGAEPDGRFTKTMILAFDETEIDPDRYGDWQSKQLDELRKLRAESRGPAR